LCCFLSI